MKTTLEKIETRLAMPAINSQARLAMPAMRMKPSVALLLLVLLASVIPVAAGAPQLGDVPRRERAKKDPRAKASRVYTNDDISTERPSPAAPGAPAQAGAKNGTSLAPFVPSPQLVVEKMLLLAQVGAEDTVYDMGCGDGRILIMAAQKFHASAVGVELDPELHKYTSARVKELNLEDKIKVIHGDMLEADISPATVVTLYLLTSANEKLRPLMEKQLRPGARIVTHDFAVPGWKPEIVQDITEEGPDVRHHTLYLYRR